MFENWRERKNELELVFIKHYAPNICLSPKYGQICSVVIPQKILDFAQTLTGNLLIIPYQLTKFQVPSSNTFRDILLTSLKCPNFQRAISREK